MEQSLEDAVLKIVTWWSDKSFRSVLNQNNGDQSSQGGLTNILMNTASMKAQDGISDEKIKKFESKLTELLLSEKNNYNRSLSVDYTPCENLFVAAKFAGINPSCFPCKSSTNINSSNKAFAKYQYGGEHKEI